MADITELLKTYGLNLVLLFLFLYYYFNRNSEKTYKKPWALLGAILMLAALLVRGYMDWVKNQPQPMAPMKDVEIIGPKDPSL